MSRRASSYLFLRATRKYPAASTSLSNHENGTAANAVSQKSLSWLKNHEVIGVADEYMPEKTHRQRSIELCVAWGSFRA